MCLDKADKRETNADLLRRLFKIGGLPESNNNIREFIQKTYGRDISVQQIAAVLGRYRDRPIMASREVDELARRFLDTCRNDLGLCKRILNRYRGVQCPA
jgi:hypothetical protein